MEGIVTEGLTRTFGDLCAVDGLTLSIPSGTVYGFLGPNGAGKTTTIRLLTGLLTPTAGRAWVAGCDVVTERAALKPRIGVVMEYQNLYERASGRANLAFFARLYGVGRERGEAVLAQGGLTERADARVATYSNGMKQRLLIARALLHEPQVLFLDEPTRGLDAHAARAIRAFVRDLTGQGTTVFLTTHYIEEADQLCGQVAVIDRGRVVAEGPPARLKEELGGPGSTLEDVFVRLTGGGVATWEAN